MDAVNDRMLPAGITARCINEEDDYPYNVVGSFENTEILCSLEAEADIDYYNYLGTTYANFYSYSNALDEISVLLNEQELLLDQPPVIENDRVMVPIRAIFEALGYNSIQWYADTQTAVAYNENNTITVQINNPKILYNNGVYLCDTFPKIVSGRILVPIRAVSECAGCNVYWNEQARTVVITSEK